MLDNFALYQFGPMSSFTTLFVGGDDSPLLDLLGFTAGKKCIPGEFPY